MLFSSPIDSRRFAAFTIFNSGCSIIDDAIEKIFLKISPGKIARSVTLLNLYNLYEVAPPLGGAHLFKIAIYSPASAPSSTVLVTNIIDGGSSLSGLIAHEIGEFQIQIVSSEKDARYPINRFEVWRNGQSCRAVMAMKDSDKWKFFQRGVVEPYEEPMIYNQALIRKRLNRDVLFRYAERAGWDVKAQAFWEASNNAVYWEELKK